MDCRPRFRAGFVLADLRCNELVWAGRRYLGGGLLFFLCLSIAFSPFPIVNRDTPGT